VTAHARHGTVRGGDPVNYLDALAHEIGFLAPCPEDLLRLYALLALTVGEDVTLENVHDAWSAWRAVSKPDHPSLVPFAELSPEVQALDAPYAEAIRQVAAKVTLRAEGSLG
jgi:hypothetical protein